jgi:hypothetical protein
MAEWKSHTHARMLAQFLSSHNLENGPVTNGARNAVTGGVGGGLRKEPVPAAVAPEGFPAQPGFGTLLTPELARTFKAALRLPTGRRDRATANRLAASPTSLIIPSRPGCS